MNYEIKRLDECCISISDGDHLPPPKSDSGVPFITISNIDTTNNTIDFSNSMFVPESYYDSLHDIRKAVSGDILYSVVGTFGVPVLIRREKKFVFQRHIAILRPNKNVVLPEYLYYVMKSGSFYTQADAFAIGSAQRTIGLGALRKMKASIPCIEDQAKAVAVLATYDNLIEVNNKKINLLEQMVENLYKEWFVRFRFPGYETAEFENGIPKDWKYYKLSSITNILSGGTPSTEHEEYYGGSIPFYTPRDCAGSFFVLDTGTKLTENGLSHCNSKLFEKGTIMITARGTVGNLNILAVPMAMNQSCYALNSDVIRSQYFLFFLLQREILKLKKMASGGVFDTIIVSTFDHIKTLLPGQELIEQFDQTISPIMEEMLNLIQQKAILVKQREYLLPRLLSGTLEVVNSGSNAS